MAKQQAYSYLRVSSRCQIEGDGFPRQKRAIQDYAAARGIEIVAEYRDEGVAGATDLENRPGLASLLAAVEADGVRMVLVERADRLARDLLVGEIILRDFRAAGVAVWSAEGGVDLTVTDNDPTKRLVRQLLGAVAEYDKTVLVLKLRAARERMRRQTGRCEGVKPFGYRPGEPEVIARMRQLRRKPQGEPRLGYHRIAKILNAEGRPTRTGSPWTSSTVRKVLLRA